MSEETITKRYSCKIIDCWYCLIRDPNGKVIGSVELDETQAWTPRYYTGTTYLPINSALRLLGYLKDSGEIE